MKYILLLPPLYISYDFLPLWFIYLYTFGILLLTVFKIPKIIAYINFVNVYFIFQTVAKSIIPETMVPILVIFLFSRIIINKHEEEFEIYPVFMWIGCFSLFSSSFYYLSYAFFSLFIIFIAIDENSSLSFRSLLKNLWGHRKQLLSITLVTILLFFFFPRFHSFLPAANINRQGKVGYSKTVNNSTISELLQSTQIAFYAKLPEKLPPEQLYWRGRVHTYNDGYNWSNRKLPDTKPIRINKGQKVISYDLKYEQDFDGDIILLDSPTRAKAKGLGLYSIGQTFEYRSYIKKKKASITAEAILNKKYKTELTLEQKSFYIQTPKFTPKELREILEKIDSTKPETVIEKFRTMILSEGYTYTLSPGLLPSLAKFIQAKKGYCSHFSSLLGLVLRKKGIPTRLVSGFQGGRFNDIGQFYEINSNDAHVWVEYFDKGLWNRVDPTGFVAPNRVRLGGNQDALGSQIEQGKANKLMRGYYRAKLFFETLNYRLSALIDSYDRGKQREISKNIKITLTNFFIIGFGLIAILLGLYYYFSNRNKVTAPHPADIYLEELLKILKPPSINIKDYKTISALKEVISDYSHQHELQEFIKLYQVSRYSNLASLDLLKKQLIAIKNLNPKK